MDDIEKQIAGLSDEEREALLAMPGVKDRIGATCKLTVRQIEGERLLRSPAKHILLAGGARSGKTFIILREIASRAIATRSRHAVLRFRFNHLKASIVYDTFPKMMRLCFPGAEWRLDKSDWFVPFGNGSEIWFGGLDEKLRTEKILGQEHSSIFFNECSQILLPSRDIAITRLAENSGLPLKAYYDANPPSRRHWSHLLFIDKIHPARHQPLADADKYAFLQMNPSHNLANLPDGYIAELENLDEKKRQRFLLGIFCSEDENALWTTGMLDKGRLLDREPPQMQRIVVSIDPSGCSGPDDLRSDEIGIIVCGLGTDGHGYVLEDLSGHFGPEQWKEIAVAAFDRWDADCIVAETNFGGSMVKEVVRSATTDGGLPVPFREVKASRSKVVRAEPVSVLFQQGRVSLVGRFPELEAQLLGMTTAGYRGDKSPDRADAMVWGLSSLYPGVIREGRKAKREPPKVITSRDLASQRRKTLNVIRSR